MPGFSRLDRTTFAGQDPWQRRFEALGHEVRIIAPQHVKPFARRQKNDHNYAEAICIAIQQPRMRFVPKKTIEQQDIQSLHRAHRRLVNHRTALVSQMRGILLDRGIGFGQSITRARRMIPVIVADLSNDLTDLSREILGSLLAFLHEIDLRVREFDRRIDRVFRETEACQRIARIRGVGPKTARRLWPRSETARTSTMAGTWRPGSAWFRASTRVVTGGFSWG